MFLIYSKTFSGQLGGLTSFFTGLSQTGYQLQLAFEKLDYVPRINRKGGLIPDTCDGKIEFNDVQFSYPTKKVNNDYLKLQDV